MEKQIDFDGQWANEYDDTAHKIIPGFDLIYELTCHLLRENLDKNAKILVAGAGTGKELIELSQKNPGFRFTGFDPAKQMLAFAWQKIKAAGLEDRISLVPGLSDDVKQKDFHAATAILVMQFLPDTGEKFTFLKGIHDRLKPGGFMVLVDLEGRMGSDEYNRLNRAWKNHQFYTRKSLDTRIEKEFMIREKEVHFIPPKRIKALLEEAGFFNIQKFFQAYLFGGYIAQKKQ